MCVRVWVFRGRERERKIKDWEREGVRDCGEERGRGRGRGKETGINARRKATQCFLVVQKIRNQTTQIYKKKKKKKKKKKVRGEQGKRE